MQRIILFLVFILFAFVGNGQKGNKSKKGKSFYEINIKTLYNQDLSMQVFKGKKLLIALCDAVNPDRERLSGLENFYQAHKQKLSVLMIPQGDFGDTTKINRKKLKKLFKDTLDLKFYISRIGRSKKKNKDKQHKVIRFVTRKDENVHFNDDIKRANEMFLLDEDGKLYAVFKAFLDFDSTTWQDILDKKITN